MAQVISLSSIFRAVMRRFWMIFLITALGTGAALAIALNRAPTFEANAVIQIEMAQVEETLAAPGAVRTSTVETRIKLIEQKLMSRDSLLEIIEKFDLFSEDPSLTPTLKVDLMRQSTQIRELMDPEQAWRPGAQPSGLIITVRLGESQLAADVANEFLSRVLIEGKSRRATRAARTLAFFEAEEARVGSAIDVLEARLAAFKTENRESLPTTLTSQRTQLATLKTNQLEIEQQLVTLQTTSDRRRAEDLARQTTLLTQQKLLLQERILVIERALAAAPEVERQLNAMERELEQLQEELTLISSRRTEAAMNQQLESQNQFERFEVLETAIAPEYAMSSGRKKLAVAGFLASGMLAVGLALGLEFMHKGIRSAAQMERELNIRPVVVIPNLDKKKVKRRRRMAWVAGVLALIAAAAALLRGRVQDMSGLLPRTAGAQRG